MVVKKTNRNKGSVLGMQMMFKFTEDDNSITTVVNLYGMNSYRYEVSTGRDPNKKYYRIDIVYDSKEISLKIDEKSFLRFERAISRTVGFYEDDEEEDEKE